MKNFLSNKVFLCLEIILFIAMCISVYCSYTNYKNSDINSAPAYINFLIAIPFLAVMLVLLLLKFIINK